MPFRFRLKSLLRHREYKLEEARTAFASAESFRLEIQRQIGELRETIRVKSEAFECEQETGMDISRYLNFVNYLSEMEREVHLMKKELEKALDESELRRREMIQWNKSVELLEGIEARDRGNYNYQAARDTQKKLDEAAVFKDYRDRVHAGRRDE